MTVQRRMVKYNATMEDNMAENDDRIAAELAKLRAEIELLEAQRLKARLELDNADLERAKLQAEALLATLQPATIKAETRKLWIEGLLYPFAAGASVVVAVLGVLRVLGLLR